MKKILLGTTALIGAGLLAGSAFAAEAPKVTVGGFTDWQFGWVNEDAPYDSDQRSHGFRNDTEINFNVDGKTENGLGYGAVIDLEADVGTPVEDGGAFGGDSSSDADNQGFNASRTYVYLEGAWGRVQLGSAEGSEETLRVDASTIARATGGINGDWRYFATHVAPGTGVFIAKPQLPLAYGLGSLGDKSTNNANKISYYTPRFYGFQGGVSYTPNSNARGQFVNRLDTTAVTQAGEVLSGGVSYNGQWDKISFAVAATGEAGQADTIGAQDLRAWNVGAKVGFMGFDLAASYGDWGDSFNANGNDSSHYWTAGGAYEWGAFGASVTYMKSQFDTGAVGTGSNDFRNLSVGVDWKLAEGLTPYAEVSWFDQDAASAAVADNSGTVFILGTLVSF